MLPMTSMTAMMHSGHSIKTNQLIKKRNKPLQASNIFSENCSLCSENLILALERGSVFLSDKECHTIHECEEKHSPEHLAETP